MLFGCQWLSERWRRTWASIFMCECVGWLQFSWLVGWYIWWSARRLQLHLIYEMFRSHFEMCVFRFLGRWDVESSFWVWFIIHTERSIEWELLYLCIVVCLKEARRWQRRAKERANLYTDTSNDEIPFVIFVPFVYRLALDWHYSDWFQSLVSLSNFTIFRQSFHCLDTYISSIVFRCFLSISLFATFVHPAHQPDIGSKRFEFTPKNIFYYEKFFSLSLITCLFFRSFYHSQHYCPDVFGGDGVRYFFYSSDCDFNFSPILITPNSIVLISVCVLVCWCECDRVMRCES